jgi:4-diphosphocytidyl-2-C-methyl-D-erythritol kinase
VIATAHAKLNLALHVRRREPDGYHALETLFAFCADGDLLELRDAPGLALGGPFAGALAAEAEDNLVTRAARAFAARFGGEAMGFHLDKRLPVASGIGGGSADAAAALRLLAKARDIDLIDPALLALAAELGADVPACLFSRTARGEGRGDRLEPVANALAGLPVLLVNPGVALATGPVFAQWDGIDRGPLAAGEPLAAAQAGRNDLETPARALEPAINAVLALLGAQDGATLVRMSGSGATCFALFADEAARDLAEAAVAEARPAWWRMATQLR